jgi:hypothetical protein
MNEVTLPSFASHTGSVVLLYFNPDIFIYIYILGFCLLLAPLCRVAEAYSILRENGGNIRRRNKFAS